MNTVKHEFRDDPRVYDEFLTVLRRFQAGNQYKENYEKVINDMQGLFRGHPILLNGFQTFVTNSMRPYYRKRRAENNNTNTRPTSRQRVNSNTARQLNQKSTQKNTRSPSPSRANQNARNADELKRMDTCAKVLKTVLRVLEVNNMHVAFPDGERFLPGPGVWLRVTRDGETTTVDVRPNPETPKTNDVRDSHVNLSLRPQDKFVFVSVTMFGRTISTNLLRYAQNATIIVRGVGRSLSPAQQNIFRSFIIKLFGTYLNQDPSLHLIKTVESVSDAIKSSADDMFESVKVGKNGHANRTGFKVLSN
jgi:hypothetical protein